MNEVHIDISFAKRELDIKESQGLTTGDFNSTKLIFNFDREDGKKVLEMINPDGELILTEEIVNNELILTGKDASGKYGTLFDKKGDYFFEVSLYTDNSKLTSAPGKLKVIEEKVKLGDEIVKKNFLMFDSVVSDVENLKKVKTINGQSIFGEGDITISGAFEELSNTDIEEILNSQV